MSDTTPTVVLVDGALAESVSWNSVIERLHVHGTALDASHRRRPSGIVGAANPPRDLSGDATYVRDVIDQDLNIPAALQRFMAVRA